MKSYIYIYRHHYTTENALHHLSETVHAELENTLEYTLDHNILINKLDNIYIKGLPIVLSTSYLQTMSQ